MFDIAWSHLAVIAVVALLVIGPKDLPRVLRTLGVWVGKARAIAREFQGSLDQMIREAELEEMKKQVEAASNLNLERELENTIDPGGELKRDLSESALTSTSSSPPPGATPAEPVVEAPQPAHATEPPQPTEPVEPVKSG